MEDVKRDCFYEGLCELLQTQLAHKMERDHLSTYDDLLLAAHELEKRKEIKDMWQWLWKKGNTIYPSHKLKGGIAKAITMARENELDKDSETEDDTGISVIQVPDKMDPEFIIRYAQAIELFSEQTRRCFACGSKEHLVQDCLSRAAKMMKANLNAKEGRAEKGACPSVRKTNV